MKLHKFKLLVTLLFLIFNYNSELYAQYEDAEEDSETSEPILPPHKRWKLNIGAGCSQLFGDLGGSKIHGTHFVRDNDFQSFRYCLSIGVEHFNKTNNFGYSTSLTYARLSGNDKFSAEKLRHDRNLSVLTQLYSLDLIAFYSPVQSRNLRFYTGFSFFYFNPTAVYNNRVYNLRSLGTEGQLLNGGTHAYSKYSFSIPFGVQLKLYTFKSNKAQLWLDLRGHKCFTDYLDDVHDVYADKTAIEAKNGKVAASLADRNISDIPGYSDPGSIRGNNQNNDSYCYLTVTYKVNLDFKGRDKDKDGVADYMDKCKNTKLGMKVDENGCDLDTDKDGVPDIRDKCPEIPGPRKNKGCPGDDQDGDGVMNYEDSCATVAGLKNFHGCPDSDGDGIPDKLDPCPLKKGSSPEQGCPDTDGDQVPDNLDDCPKSSGPISSNGCPEVSKGVEDTLALLAESIFFNTASADIKAESYQKLFDIIGILIKYPNIKIVVEGHTDSVGTFENNMKLSQRRTDAVKAFLIRYGISPSRIQAYGYGELNPIVDNGPKTRARNRRVTIKIIN